MGDAGLFVVALTVAVGLVGIIVPVVPGTILIVLGIVAWAWTTGGAAWVVLALAAALLLVGQVAMYLYPGRRMTRAGIPRTTLLTGALLGLVGFFVLPVLGLPLGFVVGVLVAEFLRHRRATARLSTSVTSTKVALGSVGLSVLIELSAGTLAALTWALGVLVLR